MSDTHIEGLEEFQEAICGHLDANNILAGYRTQRLDGNAEDLLKAIVGILADPAILAHIPAYKALQEELAHTEQCCVEWARDFGKAHERIATLEATNAAQAEQLSALQAGGEALRTTWLSDGYTCINCGKGLSAHEDQFWCPALPTHPVSANQPDSPSEYKAAAEFIAQFRHEYPAAEWLSKALLYKFNQTQVHPGDKPDGGKVPNKPLSEKQIEAGWHKTFSTSNPFCPCDLRSFTKAVRWAENTLKPSANQPDGGKVPAPHIGSYFDTDALAKATMTPKQELAAAAGYCPKCVARHLETVSEGGGMSFHQCRSCKQLVVLSATPSDSVEEGKL